MIALRMDTVSVDSVNRIAVALADTVDALVDMTALYLAASINPDMNMVEKARAVVVRAGAVL